MFFTFANNIFKIGKEFIYLQYFSMSKALKCSNNFAVAQVKGNLMNKICRTENLTVVKMFSHVVKFD